MSTLPRRVRVERDALGVWTVTGREPAEVAFRLGRLQATHHPVGLFTALAGATGRLAGTFGVAPPHARHAGRDPFLAFDLDARRFRFVEHGRRILRGFDDEVHAWVTGFARGVESVRRSLCAAPPRHCDPELATRLFSLRVTPAVICALDFRIAAHHELGRILEWTPDKSGRPAPDASNAVAVGGRRARGGGGLLLIDPHVPFFGTAELRLVLVRLRTRGYEAAGAVRLGSPFVFLGFSRHLGWTITTNWPDTLRWYLLRRRGGHYHEDAQRGGKKKLRCIEKEVTVPVRGRADRRFTLRFAGRLDRPVVRGVGGGRVVAVELGAAGAGDLSTQLYTAARVRTARAFRRRVLAVPGAALTNFVVADSNGGVGCFWHGRVPKRGGGFLDPVTEMPVDHGGDGGLVVQNNVHFDRVRPGCDAKLADFPFRVADGTESLTSYRQERTVALLGGKNKIGLDDLERLALDVHDLRGALFVKRMTAAIRGSGAVRRWSRSRRARLGRALAEVGRWNRRLEKGNRRATLVTLWMELTFRNEPKLEAAFERPDWIPERLTVRQATMGARMLLDAIDRWRASGKPTWGAVHELSVGESRLPVGGSGHVNRAAAWLVRPDLDPGTMDFPVEAGSSCVIAVHLHARGVRARFLKVLGSEEDPASPDHATMALDWARGRFSPLRLR